MRWKALISVALLALLLTGDAKGQVTVTNSTDYALVNRRENDQRPVGYTDPYFMWSNEGVGKLAQYVIVDTTTVKSLAKGREIRWTIEVEDMTNFINWTTDSTADTLNFGTAVVNIQEGYLDSPIETSFKDTLTLYWADEIWQFNLGTSYIDIVTHAADSIGTGSKLHLYYMNHVFQKFDSDGRQLTSPLFEASDSLNTY